MQRGRPAGAVKLRLSVVHPARMRRVATLTMASRPAQSAEQHWPALIGSALIAEVIEAIQFVDGLRIGAARNTLIHNN